MIDMRKAEQKLIDTVREWIDENPDEYKKLKLNNLQHIDNESNKN